jgi:hypothetical protein
MERDCNTALSIVNAMRYALSRRRELLNLPSNTGWRGGHHKISGARIETLSEYKRIIIKAR